MADSAARDSVVELGPCDECGQMVYSQDGVTLYHGDGRRALAIEDYVLERIDQIVCLDEPDRSSTPGSTSPG